ncbi:CPBP family intramembrane glutamic endopeptidase [Marinactinospora thermotolerans]|uniref:CAAX prenyl protease 2/Lysostaphin resistance protein A-like domain-containing protein n=1 Tax=Marinactinospora thermotolerans DSM 45154 TaxID=1122192 RepID=A0A1T4KK06_9ACTN|nr:CPBP family intramembrane glutamic endopeptidase [Marinactinospora thermotolerans]SJZ42749.1 hypothetical protein SAMN02745673_00416 [Marinactinospora thermotolerans DSM 45154]
MTTPPTPRRRGLASAAWRIALATTALGTCVAAGAAVLPAGDPSDTAVLMARIAFGVAISALMVGLIAVLARRADRETLRGIGVTTNRVDWRLALWGAAVWTVPAAAAFGVLALLGAPLTVTVSAAELARTGLLLLFAVLVVEAVPEEVVFRGYVTTVLGRVTRGWWIIVVQALLFTLFAGLLRQNWNPLDLSLFVTMGIGFGYLRMLTGSVWMPIGFHAAFQTGAQLILAHDAVEFAGGTGAAMLALGAVPFSVAAVLVTAAGVPRSVAATPGGTD